MRSLLISIFILFNLTANSCPPGRFYVSFLHFESEDSWVLSLSAQNIGFNDCKKISIMSNTNTLTIEKFDSLCEKVPFYNDSLFFEHHKDKTLIYVKDSYTTDTVTLLTVTQKMNINPTMDSIVCKFYNYHPDLDSCYLSYGFTHSILPSMGLTKTYKCIAYYHGEFYDHIISEEGKPDKNDITLKGIVYDKNYQPIKNSCLYFPFDSKIYFNCNLNTSNTGEYTLKYDNIKEGSFSFLYFDIPNSSIEYISPITIKGKLGDTILVNIHLLDYVGIEDNFFKSNCISVFDKYILIKNTSMQPKSFYLYSSSGNQILKKSLPAITKELIIDIHEYKPGIYFCSLIDDNGILQTSKIIIH